MNKFKKIIISLLISGALSFCFTACGGGGGGSGGGDSGTVEDGDSDSSLGADPEELFKKGFWVDCSDLSYFIFRRSGECEYVLNGFSSNRVCGTYIWSRTATNRFQIKASFNVAYGDRIATSHVGGGMTGTLTLNAYDSSIEEFNGNFKADFYHESSNVVNGGFEPYTKDLSARVYLD